MSYDVTDAPCPTCGEPAGHPCRTRKTRRVTDTHIARDAASFRLAVDRSSRAIREGGEGA